MNNLTKEALKRAKEDEKRMNIKHKPRHEMTDKQFIKAVKLDIRGLI